MICFWNDSDWDSAYQNQLDIDTNIIIDLRECSSEEDFILLITTTLSASFSTKQGLGKNLDALSDVVSDYLNEHWLQWKDVYLVGWKYFIEKHPIFSQKLLNALNNTYLKSISSMLMMINWGDITFEEARLLEALTDSKPRMFLILN